MIRTDRLLVCEFSHLTATPSCAIMLTLGKIGQNPILSQHGRPLYHIRLPLSIYFFQILPEIFRVFFIASIPHCRGRCPHRPAANPPPFPGGCRHPPLHTMPQIRLLWRLPRAVGSRNDNADKNTPRLRCSRGRFTLCGISLFKSFSTKIRSRNESRCFLCVTVTANNQISCRI